MIFPSNPQLEWCRLYGLHEWGIWRRDECRHDRSDPYEPNKHWCPQSLTERRECSRCGTEEKRSFWK